MTAVRIRRESEWGQLEATVILIEVRRARFTGEASNAITPGRYQHEEATFFLTRTRNGPVMGIDAQVAWSRTKHGGVEYEPEPPRGGCMRWGLCDVPARDGDDAPASTGLVDES